MTETDFQARIDSALQWLDACWGCEYWSRDEQAFAMAEGWSLSVFSDYDENRDRIHRSTDWTDTFKTDAQAIEYVTTRAQEGSPLHCRALVLHLASVLRGGAAL